MEQANALLKNSEKFPKDSNIIMMIRHSEREPLDSNKKNSDLQLTQKGHRAAKIFGSMLPIRKSVRVFYSNRDRCRDTAFGIIKGFKEKGGTVFDGGALKPLYSLKNIRNNFFKEELQQHSLLEIMNRWIDEHYPIDDIERIESYSQRAAQVIWSKIDWRSQKASIDIHVSHEVLLMALRSGWFNLNPNDKWTDFLGGYAFTFRKNHILLLDFDEFIKIPYPSWWKK